MDQLDSDSSMNIDSLRFALLHSDQRFQTEYRAQGLFELNQDNEASVQSLLDLLQSVRSNFTTGKID